MDVGVSQTWVEELALNPACFLPRLSNRFLFWQVGRGAVIICPPVAVRGRLCCPAQGGSSHRLVQWEVCPWGRPQCICGSTLKALGIWFPGAVMGWSQPGRNPQWGPHISNEMPPPPAIPYSCLFFTLPSLGLLTVATLLGDGSKSAHPKHPLSGIC